MGEDMFVLSYSELWAFACEEYNLNLKEREERQTEFEAFSQEISLLSPTWCLSAKLFLSF